MGERMPQQKYIPINYDPSKVPRMKKKKKGTVQEESRIMIPMSIKCLTCREYTGSGTKFNARKEVTREAYLGIKVIRFYFKCKWCGAETIMKTDPKNADYVMEKGAQRNYEPWKDENELTGTEDEPEGEDAQTEAEKDTMKMLEAKVQSNKMEMEALDQLDELRTQNAALGKISSEELLARHQRGALGKDGGQEDGFMNGDITEEDEAHIAKQFAIKRLDDAELEHNAGEASGGASTLVFGGASAKRKRAMDSLVSAVMVNDPNETRSESVDDSQTLVVAVESRKKRKGKAKAKGKKAKTENSNTVSQTGVGSSSTGAVSLLGGYGSDSSDDED